MARGEVVVYIYSFFKLGARWEGVWEVLPPSRPLLPRERDPVSIVQDAGWVLCPVLTGAEISKCGFLLLRVCLSVQPSVRMEKFGFP